MKLLANTSRLFLLSTCVLFYSAVHAEQIRIPSPAAVTLDLARGASMGEVEKQWGNPEKKHAAVGAPPITRWDYPSYSVFFEHSKLLHIVKK